jgi:hypothetical protein
MRQKFGKILAIVVPLSFLLTISIVDQVYAVSYPYKASLSAQNEVPPVESSASGDAEFTEPTNGIIKYRVNITGISNASGAQIYAGAEGQNGTVVADLLYTPTSQNRDMSYGMIFRGDLDDSSLKGPMTGKTIDDLAAAMDSGEIYLNVQTGEHPDGEIRDQLSKTDKIVNVESNPDSSVGSNPDSSKETWQTFKDPENEFSIEYPSSWQLKPAENRFATTDLTIMHSNGFQDGFVTMSYNIVPEELTQIIKKYGADQKDIDDVFKTIFPTLLTSSSAAFDSFHQVEDTDYKKYKVDGLGTASTIFSFKQSGLDFAGWSVGALTGNKIFWFHYAADPNQFDSNFPIAERMLQSIKLLDK